MSSLYEKCYHSELQKLIEEGKRDFYNLEQKFIDKMVTRLAKCEDLFSQSGTFPRSCLFDEQTVPANLKSKVDACVRDSFEQPGDFESKNTVLQADLKWAKDHHLDFHPSITINDFSYRGDIEFQDIREAICAAYQERPSTCDLDEIWASESTLRPYDERDFFTVKPKNVKAEGDHSRFELKSWEVFIVVVSIIIFNFFLWLYLQRKTRHETSE